MKFRIIRPLTGAVAVAAAMLALPTAAHAARGADGYSNWSRVGAATMRSFQGGNANYQAWARSEALHGLGFNASETQAILDRFNGETCSGGTRGTMRAGDTFDKMSYQSRNRVRLVNRVRLTDQSQESFETCEISIRAGERVNGYLVTRDINVTLVYKCGNVGIRENYPAPPPPPPPAAPPASPPTVTVTFDAPPPPPPAAPPADATPPDVVEEAEAAGWCPRINWNVTAGFETQVRRNGNGTDVAYVTLGAYCQHHVRGTQDDWFGPGIMMNASGYRGTAAWEGGNGRYSGEEGYLQLAAKYSTPDWDLAAGVGPGVIRGRFRDNAGNGFSRSNTAIGLNVQYNNWSNPMGDFTAWAGCGLPIGGHSDAYTNGVRTGDGPRLNGHCFIGAKQHFSRGRAFNPYLSGNLFGESNTGGPDSLNLGLRAGFTDRSGHFSCGIGPDINLLRGGMMLGMGCSVSVNGIIRDRRTRARAAGIEYDAGDEEPAATRRTGLELFVPESLPTDVEAAAE